MNQLVNSSFSTTNPLLQLAWDSTSLGALKECPRKYQLTIVEGWTSRRTSVHLLFGLHYHAALERYDHSKAQGAGHEQATLDAVRCALTDTWDEKLNRPWISDDPNKNRLTLLRTIVWYLEQFKDDPLETIILANGKPAVELSFRFETDYQSYTGENFILCGHIDRLVKLNDQVFVADRKTTKTTIDQRFFEHFTPDNQFSLYNFATKVIWEQPAQGIIVDGAQIAVTFSRFLRGEVSRSDEFLTDWYSDLGYWLQLAQFFAKNGHWPMNEKSCSNYGGCPFRGTVCSHAPSMRKQWLKGHFVKRVWDPLKVRGDI